jgi:type IV pilus assembly protein PilW
MKRANLRYGSRARNNMGFSLVELMVALTVGLIVALAVTSSVLTMGRQLSVISSNAAAQSSAQIALSVVDAAGRAAGAGFYNNGRLICRTWNAWNGSAVVSNGAVLMPARIASGGSNTVSDTIVFTGATVAGPLSAVPVLDAAPGASLMVSNGATLAVGDVAVVGVPGSDVPCTLFQVDQAPGVVSACGGNAPSCQHLIRNPNSGLNPNPTTFTSAPTYGFAMAGTTKGPAVVSRVGSTAVGFRQDAFSVQCNSLVRSNAFVNPTVPACTASPLGFGAGVDAIAMSVVLMHAQYGVSDTAASDVVTSWVAPTGATWGAPSADNVARIKALRVVLVARAKEAEGTQVTSACTNRSGVVNTGPCSFQDAAAPVIDLSATAVAAGKTWQNYRYRVHQAIIPLRNVIWSDS